MCHKKKIKFQDYKNCLEAAQIKYKTNHFKLDIKQSVDSIESYAYEMNKNLPFKKEETKCNNQIKQDKKVLINILQNIS